MSKFHERLWRDLEREHGGELAQIERPAAGRAGHVRPRLLAGTTAGLAGLGTAIALLLSAASTPAAFAVTGNPDGTVSVVLKQITGIKGANERLAALGVRAKFVQVLPGCRTGVPAAAVPGMPGPRQLLIHAGRQTRIDPRKIPPGRMLVIVSWASARHVHVAKLGSAVRAAPNCIAGPPPAALRRAWALAHGQCHVEVRRPKRAAIVPAPGASGVIKGDSGPVTGNSGPFTGNSDATTGNSGASTGNSGAAPPPPPGLIQKLGKGCPPPLGPPTQPPGTGNSSTTGNS